MTTTADPAICFDLQKKTEIFTFELAKRGIAKAPTMRVCAALDISGSMDDEIRDGSLQKAMDQLGAVGIKFDDNGEIDVWVFDDRSSYIGTWSPDDYKTFIRDHNIQSRGGTAYSPFINDIVQKMYVTGCGTQTQVVKQKVGGFLGFGGKTVETVIQGEGTQASDDPVLVMVITDGEPYNDDISRISKAIDAAARGPTFFTFVGVSNQHSSFPTLEALNKKHDNVGVCYLNNFNLKDEQVYEQLVTDKLVNFLKKF